MPKMGITWPKVVGLEHARYREMARPILLSSDPTYALFAPCVALEKSNPIRVLKLEEFAQKDPV